MRKVFGAHLINGKPSNEEINARKKVTALLANSEDKFSKLLGGHSQEEPFQTTNTADSKSKSLHIQNGRIKCESQIKEED
jgi:hypothetical protein